MPGAIIQNIRYEAVTTILGRATINLVCRLERLAALKPPDHERITRRGQFSGIERSGDEKRVLVFPGDSLFSPRQLEAVLDETSGRQIKFPHCHSVFAAIGQIDHAATLGGFGGYGAFPEPVGLLDFRQVVKVQDRGPRRRIALITVQGGAAPNAVDVIRILPKIENLTAEYVRGGYAVFRLRDRQRIRIESAVARVLFQDGESLVVFGVDPLHGTRAVNVFQPDIRIIECRGGQS